MTEMFDANDYVTLHNIVFQHSYPGYDPATVEAPNGDGKKDEGKQYAHVNKGYIADFYARLMSSASFDCNILTDYLTRCHNKAIAVALHLGLDSKYWPSEKYSTLRVLKYPPGVGSVAHTDPDLFTLSCYRNSLSLLKLQYDTRYDDIFPGLYYGEMLPLVQNRPATVHSVDESSVWQYAIVYFAIPDHGVKFPSGETVNEWLNKNLYENRRYEK